MEYKIAGVVIIVLFFFVFVITLDYNDKMHEFNMAQLCSDRGGIYVVKREFGVNKACYGSGDSILFQN